MVSPRGFGATQIRTAISQRANDMKQYLYHPTFRRNYIRSCALQRAPDVDRARPPFGARLRERVRACCSDAAAEKLAKPRHGSNQSLSAQNLEKILDGHWRIAQGSDLLVQHPDDDRGRQP
jgi:hypothetical protein